MCAATAAAVGTAVAAVATVGTQVASAVSGPSGGGAGGSSGGPPKQQKVQGFAPATGLQSYTARLLAANKDVLTPGFDEWAQSGGSLRPDWKMPDLTPREAQQLQFVEKKTGRPFPTYDPTTGGPLSPAAQASLGRERARNLKEAGYEGKAQDPQVRYGQLSAREEMLQTKLAERGGPGSAPALEKRLANVQKRKDRVAGRLGIGTAY